MQKTNLDYQVVSGSNDEGNNSTLRRKLFAGLNDDDDSDEVSDVCARSSGDVDNEVTSDDVSVDVRLEETEEKENDVDLSNIILPGSVMMTPTAAKKEKSPNKSVIF